MINRLPKMVIYFSIATGRAHEGLMTLIDSELRFLVFKAAEQGDLEAAISRFLFIRARR